jgi:hypothetical protein
MKSASTVNHCESLKTVIRMGLYLILRDYNCWWPTAGGHTVGEN